MSGGIRRSLILIEKYLNPQQKMASRTKSSKTDEFSFKTKPFKLHRLEAGPPDNINITKEEALKYYKQMAMIRRIEASSAALYKEKVIRGFCHLSTGQEAVAVGIRAAMRQQDNIISAYRIHGIAYIMDISPLGILAELTGRESGCVRGKGGSMHMYAKNFYGGNGIVGAQVPLGAGIALACKYQGNNSVCITVYGDGASNQGQVFEAYNMAYLWKLPCIFVCENNGFGMGTSVERHSCNTEYYKRGDVLPGIWVDGMDVVTVKAAFNFAINFVLENCPIVIEVCTYRYHGHSMSDPGTSYRSRDEIQMVRQTRDPITQFKELITNQHNITTEDELKVIDAAVREEVDEATEKSKTDPEISVDELHYDVYANNLEPKIRGITAADGFDHKNVNKVEK